MAGTGHHSAGDAPARARANHWGEAFAAEPEILTSKRVYLCAGAQILRSRQALYELRDSLRDAGDAERLLRLGKAEALVADPQRGVWARLRPAERPGERAAQTPAFC